MKVIPAEARPVTPDLFDASTRNLDPALERLKRFHPAGMELTLGRIHRLLDALGNPQNNLPPVFHVGGTNGKGSTVAFLRAILEASGLTVHAYTSPHLVKYNERIRIAGKLIEDDALHALIEEVENVNDLQEISFFEITTALALHAFAQTPADAVLLEVGLGGILDATNVIERPAATAITRISYDHTHILGDTIEEIAGEKAGILKAGTPAILAWQKEAAAQQLIEARAAEIGAPLFQYGVDWTVEGKGDCFTYRDAQGQFDLPMPALLGEHQMMNAGTALAMLRCSGQFQSWKLDLAGGMNKVEWPGRLQRIETGALAELLPPHWELWLDGGHNDSGGEVLARQAMNWAVEEEALPLTLIFGMLNTKKPADFLAPMAPYVRELRAIAIPDEPLSLSADEAAAAARDATIVARPAASIAEAVTDLAASGAGPRRILICGSLYLAGKILAMSA